MNSMAGILEKAGLVTPDQRRVAERLKADIRAIESDLRILLKYYPDHERVKELKTRLAVLKRTKVVE